MVTLMVCLMGKYMVLPMKPYSIKLSHLAMSPSGVGAHQRTISIVSQIRSVGVQKVRVLREEFSYNSPGNNITCQVIENKMCTCRRSVRQRDAVSDMARAKLHSSQPRDIVKA